MEAYDRLLELAAQNGIKLNGISPQKIFQSGTGMVAQRLIKPHEVILTVPTCTFRSRDTVAASIKAALPADFSAHGMLAAEILLDQTDDFAVWRGVFPSRADFESCSALLWDASLQELLPAVSRSRLDVQKTAFTKDWEVVHDAFPEISESEYRYAWLLVNTRGFYNNSPRMKRYPHKDRLALQPVVDLLNHAGTGCNVNFGALAFTVKADRMYMAGEEVFLSYGAHSNDFLLAEYGFVLDENPWDEICLDEVLCPLFTAAQRKTLKESNFWAKYMADPKTPGCYRTQVALRLLILSSARWERVVSGLDEAEDVQPQINGILNEALRKYQSITNKTQQRLGTLQSGTSGQKSLLAKRWTQIEGMVALVQQQL
ncbi:Ribosomal N-lysine methyltransferase 2 [Ceratocystis lukuohia]|uniref:Ribosomal N-lysine methyltransferase 2 n=1 Tax=Ceratocystis lukuohia TaxID=2019550 RepID=A0ABR4MH69_9PEZI